MPLLACKIPGRQQCQKINFDIYQRKTSFRVIFRRQIRINHLILSQNRVLPVFRQKISPKLLLEDSEYFSHKRLTEDKILKSRILGFWRRSETELIQIDIGRAGPHFKAENELYSLHLSDCKLVLTRARNDSYEMSIFAVLGVYPRFFDI